MESPPHATETQPAGAYAAHKCSNGKENDEAPSLAERVRDALRRQPLTDRGAARDAVEPPQRECFELSDGERAELHTYLATGAAAQPPALKVAQDPSDRKQRADAFADARGHAKVDVDAHAAAALRCAYARCAAAQRGRSSRRSGAVSRRAASMVPST